MARPLCSPRFWLPLALAAGCLLIVAAALLEPLFRAKYFRRAHEERVFITGVSIPKGGTEQLIYTDHGAYRVCEQLRGKTGGDESSFLFHIGESYRVQVKGAAVECFLGKFRPVICDAELVNGQLAASGDSL